MKKLTVRIFSDYTCPFCYLLYVKMERLKGVLPIEVEWLPVLAHPETPNEGLLLKELIRDQQYLRDAVESVMKLARQDSIDLILPERASSSKMAVWMSECARQNGKFDEYHRRVYEAYFQEGKDIGDDRTIPEIMKCLKIPKEAIAAFGRDREEYGRTISARILECRQKEITQVPTIFLRNRKIEGSLPYSLLYRMIEDALRSS
jgi:predicted DsbA family dithiol-disulfide isomerase